MNFEYRAMDIDQWKKVVIGADSPVSSTVPCPANGAAEP
jgi:hypothetical protein